MNGGIAVPLGKHTQEGEAVRLELLSKEFGADVERWLKLFPKYARSDVIDAFAMLRTARRFASGTYLRLPGEGSEINSCGLRAEIVA